jgi:hypothetical protein
MRDTSIGFLGFLLRRRQGRNTFLTRRNGKHGEKLPDDTPYILIG